MLYLIKLRYKKSTFSTLMPSLQQYSSWHQLFGSTFDSTEYLSVSQGERQDVRTNWTCKNCFGVATPLYQSDNGFSLSLFLFDVPFSTSFRPIIHEWQPCYHLNVRQHAYPSYLDILQNKRREIERREVKERGGEGTENVN